MTLERSQIRQLYKEAKNKEYEVTILAEVNACRRKDIIDILGDLYEGQSKQKNEESKELVAHFARVVRSAMNEQQISQLELAKETGIPHRIINNYLIGYRPPTVINVVKISRALGISCDALIMCDED